MGNDWYLYDLNIDNEKLVKPPRNDEEQIIIWRQCSINFKDIYDKYGFDKNVLHGHNGPVVTDYLSKIIKKMVESKVKVLTVEQLKTYKTCANFWWGLNEHKNRIEEWIRESIVLNRFRLWRDIAEQHYDSYWYGDQTYFLGKYNLNGCIIKGYNFVPEDDIDTD